VLFGTHTGPGAFYKLMPHNAMAALFGAAFLYAIVALVMGVRAFWRDIGEPVGMKTDIGALLQAIRDAGELRYLDGGGVGCFNEDDRPTDRRRLYHHLTFYGFTLRRTARPSRYAASICRTRPGQYACQTAPAGHSAPRNRR